MAERRERRYTPHCVSHRTSSTVLCQIALAVLAGALRAPAAAQSALPTGVALSTAPASLPPPPPPARLFSPREADIDELLRRFAEVHFFGVGSFNWRNIGPKYPGYETQIQDEVYLADMYFGLEVPLAERVPFHVEFNVPTELSGAPQLFQLYAEYDRIQEWKFQVGKFIVPYGRYNELYRPDQFLTVTRPLLYASPDSIDLEVRPNSPVPPVSAGDTDVGARVSWYPQDPNPLVPEELTLFIVNGLDESDSRSRTFPNPENLGIAGPPTSGVELDFGHQNNGLADNNNAKSVGGRAVFALGDLRLPWPFPERGEDLDGLTVSFSGMGGSYDLENQLYYQMWAADWSFEYQGVSFSGEAEYEVDQFKNAEMVSTSTDLSPQLVLQNGAADQIRLREENYGYFLQAVFPVMRRPPVGERVTGVFVFNQMYRRGPLLDFLLNVPDPANGGDIIPSMTAYKVGSPQVQTRINKYTGALNWKLTDHFTAKLEYSYWAMANSTVLSATSMGNRNIYQTALSMVVGF